jgi:hypothetical protein
MNFTSIHVPERLLPVRDSLTCLIIAVMSQNVRFSFFKCEIIFFWDPVILKNLSALPLSQILFRRIFLSFKSQKLDKSWKTTAFGTCREAFIPLSLTDITD